MTSRTDRNKNDDVTDTDDVSSPTRQPAVSRPRLRSSLLLVLVGDAMVFLVLLGLALQQSIVRLICVLIAVIVPMALFCLASPSSYQLVRSEHRSQSLRSRATFVACAAAAALFTCSLGFNRSVPDQSARQIAATLGPVDIMIGAPSAASLEQARAAVVALRGRSDVAGLIDADPLVMRAVDGAVMTSASPTQVRVVEVDPAQAAGFGQAPTLTGFVGVALAANDAFIPEPVARLLGTKVGDTLRVQTSAGPELTLRLTKIAPQRGLLGLPGIDGSTVTNVFVGPGTMASLDATGLDNILAVSLCGRTTTRVLNNGVRESCSNDPIESSVYVQRVDDELGRAIALLPPSVPSVATAADPLFGDGTVANEPSPASGVSLTITPIKQRLIDEARSQHRVVQRALDLSTLPIGVASLVGLVAAGLIIRNKRWRVDRSIGLSASHSTGEQTLLVALAGLPGVFVGTALGVVVVRIVDALLLASRDTSAIAAPNPVELFADGLAAAVMATVAATVAASWMANRIEPGTLITGHWRHRAARWWKAVAVLLVALGLVTVALSSSPAFLVGGLAILGFGLVGLAVSGGRLDGQSRPKIMTRVGVVLFVMMTALAWWLTRRQSEASIGDRWSVLIVLSILSVASVSWIMIARHSEIGRRIAGFGVRASDRALITTLRSRSAKRAGPWSLTAPVAFTFAFSAAAAIAGVLGTSAAQNPNRVITKLVEINDVYPGGDLTSVAPIEVDGAGRIIVTRFADVRGIALSNGELSDRTLGVQSTRSIPVNMVPDESAADLLQRLGAGSTPLTDGSAIANRADFLAVFGHEPQVGDRVNVLGPSEEVVSLQVVTVIDGTTNGALWVGQTTWNQLNPPHWFGRRLVSPAPGESLDRTRTQLMAALRGQAVAFGTDPTSRNSVELDGERVARVLRWMALVISAVGVGALALRWTSPRRAELHALRLADSDSLATRSISHDLVGHLGTPGWIGVLTGVYISLALRPLAFVGGPPRTALLILTSSPWLYLIVAAAWPTLLALLVARLRGLPRRSESTHVADVVALPTTARGSISA
jgi:hypothetical protein